MNSVRLIILILLIIALAGSAAAKSDLGLKSLGAKVGFVKPEDIDGTFGLGVQANFGTIIPELALDGFIEYWGKSYDNGYGSGDASLSDIVIGGMVKYFFKIESKTVRPYVGGALALHFVSFKADNPGGPDFSDSETDLGIHLAGGAEMELSPQLNGFGELKYAISDGSYLAIFFGVNYLLGK